MDALCQAIESYWAVNSTAESRKYAREAMKLAYKSIEKAIGNDKKARVAMSKAAFLSGKAINISKTTACHSISYPLSAHFNIPHEHAVALSMPEILEFNYDTRGAEFVNERIKEIFSILGFKDEKDAKKKFKKLIEKTVKKSRLRNFGIEKKDIEFILNESFTPSRMNNNPRKISKDNLKEILRNIW